MGYESDHDNIITLVAEVKNIRLTLDKDIGPKLAKLEGQNDFLIKFYYVTIGVLLALKFVFKVL